MLPDFEREIFLEPLTIVPDKIFQLKAPQPIQKQTSPKFALALDLEGTLIDDVHDITPRTGLSYFLSCCKSTFDHVVIFTAVDTIEAKTAINKLIHYHRDLKLLLNLKIVDWIGKAPTGTTLPKFEGILNPYKDLKYVYRMLSAQVPMENIFIVDNDKWWINPEQKTQWVGIETFCGMNNQDHDTELFRVLAELLVRKAEIKEYS